MNELLSALVQLGIITNATAQRINRDLNPVEAAAWAESAEARARVKANFFMSVLLGVVGEHAFQDVVFIDEVMFQGSADVASDYSDKQQIQTGVDVFEQIAEFLVFLQ